MKIAIIGAGYVGLVTSAWLSQFHQVQVIDKCVEKIEGLFLHNIPIYEPDLDKMLFNDNISFSTDFVSAVHSNDVIMIAVGTPENYDGSCDVSAVFDVAEMIAKHANSDKTVVVKSTVPVGTSSKLKGLLSKSKYRHSVVSNPEFLKEGEAMADISNPDRIIIGCKPELIPMMSEMYAVQLDKLVFVSNEDAELAKCAANAMLATRISFMNEIANIAELSGADITNVEKCIGLDSRIGSKYLKAGLGYGGSCLPKDVASLISVADSLKCSSKILRAVQATNSSQKNRLFDKIIEQFDDVYGKTFAVWGIAFKPNTDDIRDAPADQTIAALLNQGAMIKYYDPKATSSLGHKRIIRCSSKEEALEKSHALLIFTEWDEFNITDFSIFDRMHQKNIFDGRNIFDHQEMKKANINYKSIGR